MSRELAGLQASSEPEAAIPKVGTTATHVPHLEDLGQTKPGQWKQANPWRHAIPFSAPSKLVPHILALLRLHTKIFSDELDTLPQISLGSSKISQQPK
jgi:hypothetical protein